MHCPLSPISVALRYMLCMRIPRFRNNIFSFTEFSMQALYLIKMKALAFVAEFMQGAAFSLRPSQMEFSHNSIFGIFASVTAISSSAGLTGTICLKVNSSGFVPPIKSILLHTSVIFFRCSSLTITLLSNFSYCLFFIRSLFSVVVGL